MAAAYFQPNLACGFTGMSDTVRRLLYVIMLICSVIIGWRAYLAVNPAEPPRDELAMGAVESNSFPDKLPAFTLNDQWGEPQPISNWAGKPLLLNFWATWCAPCRREMPLLEAVHKQRDDIAVLGIAIDRVADVQTFLAEAGISYPTLVGEQDAMEVSDQFGLSGLGLPFTVLVSGAGDILTIFIGEIEASEIQALVDTAIAVESGALDLKSAREQLGSL